MIEQFSGYFGCNDISMRELEPRSISVQALLGIEGVTKTQILKQPDVLMLLYLFPDLFDEQIQNINCDYYTARTDHTYGSSLGPAIQAIISCRMGNREEAYEHFMHAAQMDLLDKRGNTVDGIHGATAGGVWQAVVFGFAGLHITLNKWEVKPSLPAHWKRLSFKFYLHGHLQNVDIRNNSQQKVRRTGLIKGFIFDLDGLTNSSNIITVAGRGC
jgi:kojibiose phosphorylase